MARDELIRTGVVSMAINPKVCEAFSWENFLVVDGWGKWFGDAVGNQFRGRSPNKGLTLYPCWPN